MASAGMCRNGRSICVTALLLTGLGAAAFSQVRSTGQASKLFRTPASESTVAQIAPVLDEPPAASSGATTREMVRRLTRAKELIAEESYAEGTRLLQTILDSDEDVFFHPDEQNKSLERSLKSAALELLGRLPFDGRESYETQHGPAAKKLLDEALREGDPARLGVVARRYFHTQAGYEAAYRLAADHLDHSRPLAAALCLDRLRQARNARLQFDPMLSLKTAVSWQRAGMSSQAQEILVELKNSSRNGLLTIGGREVGWFERPDVALAWLEGLFGPADRSRQPGPEEWAMVGGNPSRNGESTGGSPYLNRSWRASTAEGVTSSVETDEQVARALEEKRQATGRNADELIPALPSFQPLVVNNLVIVRSVGDIRAYELATGKLAWASGEKDQTLAESLRGNPVLQSQMGVAAPFSILVVQRAWNDAAYGTMSSDGEYVYAVEDLGLATTQVYTGVPRQQPARDHNRLIALDARTGKAMWEVGGPKTQNPDELAGTFFLGPPLVLDQRLFCLAEAAGEVRLLVLDPRTGRLEWSQFLIDLASSGADFFRRQSGLTPAFEGGIVVCPTGSGQVVAVDLTSRSLLWKYKFRDLAEGYDPRMQPFLVIQQNNMLQRVQGTGGNDPNRWLDTAVLIGEAKVVLTPRDTGEIHCLNLMDGSVVWKKPRGEGLFVAGVRHGRVIVVGKSYVQALRLADGVPAWPEPTAISMPSGRGYGSGDTYHLPLTSAEVATLNLANGQIIARSKSLGDHVPGNLVGVRGGIVSLGIDFVEAFQQLETLMTEISGALKKNPDDVDALAMRGQMELQRGRFREAYADLKRALELKSDDVHVRELMLGSLLEGLRVDFASYRDLRPEIERLIVDPAQRSTYLWLQAGGLQRAGEIEEAFDVLLGFGDPRVADSELDRLDGTMSIRRDRLVRSRVQEIYAAAKPVERAALDKALETRVAAVLASNDDLNTARFLSYFGEFPAAAPLQKQSAERSVYEGDWLAEEFRLRKLAESSDKPIAAAASARLAGLLMTAERTADALAMISRLKELWPDVPLGDGKTGALVAQEWLKKPAIEQLLSLREPWPTGLVEADRLQNVGVSTGTRAYPIPIVNDRGPFYRGVTLEVNTRGQEFTARDVLGRPLWKVSLESQSQYASSIGNSAHVSGHLAVLSVGTQLVAIDPLGTADSPGARILWRQPLTEVPSSTVLPVAIGVRRGRNPYSEFSGRMGPVTRDYVCFQRGKKLLVLDPLSGRPVWTRDGMPPGGELLGDEEFIISIAPDNDTATVFRALDGKLLATRKVPSVSSNFRRDLIGRNIVIWGPAGPEQQVVSMWDVWADRKLWDRRFPQKSQYRLIGLDEAAVLEPGGKFTVIGLPDGAVRFQASADPEPDLSDMIVQRTPEQYLLIANTQIPPMARPNTSRVLSQFETVNGKIYGFERPTGRRLWMTPVERQGLDPYQSTDLPALVMIVQTTESSRDMAVPQTRSHLLCVDRRNGRVIYDQPFPETTYTLETSADPDLKQIELKMSRSTVKLTFTNKPVPE